VSAAIALLFALAWRFAVLSLFAVGAGVTVVLPQIHQEFVQHLRLLDDRAFTEMLAVSQAAPGPNFLFVPLLGWRIDGWPGAIVCLLAFLFFPMIISFTVGRVLHDRENATLAMVRRSFRPVTGGLWIASGLVVALTTDHTPIPAIITAAVLVASLAFDISPLWWCLAAGAAGALLA